MTRPLAIDLFCGLGGWTSGLLAEGLALQGYPWYDWICHTKRARLLIDSGRKFAKVVPAGNGRRPHAPSATACSWSARENRRRAPIESRGNYHAAQSRTGCRSCTNATTQNACDPLTCSWGRRPTTCATVAQSIDGNTSHATSVARTIPTPFFPTPKSNQCWLISRRAGGQ